MEKTRRSEEDAGGEGGGGEEERGGREEERRVEKNRTGGDESEGEDESEEEEERGADSHKAPVRVTIAADAIHASAQTGHAPLRPMTSQTSTSASSMFSLPEEEEWKPGSEPRKWTDPSYKATKYAVAGIHHNHNKDFIKPEGWWWSAEEAMKVLQVERKGLKALGGQQSRVVRGLLEANRFLARGFVGLTDRFSQESKGHDELQAISHVLPPHVQRQLHAKTCQAAKKGDTEMIRSLLRFEVDMDFSDSFGTPLHYAAAFGQVEITNMLLQRGAFPGSLNLQHQTPLHLAVSRNHRFVAELLVRYGAPLNARDVGGTAPIHAATSAGHAEAVEALIAGGADCNRSNLVGWTPLHMAALGGHHEILERICVSALADPNIGCSVAAEGELEGQVRVSARKGDTPLHLAARLSCEECTRILLNNGANPYAVNEDGDTALHVCVKAKSLKLTEMLLEGYWHAVNDKNMARETPLDICDQMLFLSSSNSDEDVESRQRMSDIKVLLRSAVLKAKTMPRKEWEEEKEESEADSSEEDELMKVEDEETFADEIRAREQLISMHKELEAARAQVKTTQEQSKTKTHTLNETVIDLKRRLAETEFILERERTTRQELEKELADLLDLREDQRRFTLPACGELVLNRQALDSLEVLRSDSSRSTGGAALLGAESSDDGLSTNTSNMGRQAGRAPERDGLLSC
eukprot:763139-Hanusia_phi.AAC.6